MLEAFLIVCTWLAIFIAAALAIPAVFAVGAFIGLVAGLIIASALVVGYFVLRILGSDRGISLADPVECEEDDQPRRFREVERRGV